jgi:predicted permease
MVSDVLYRLRAILRRKPLEEELGDELELHLELETKKLEQSGLSPKEAARQARISFGGLEQVREQCRASRGVSVWDVTQRDLRYGIRQLRWNPGFTAAIVSILALGIGANTALFSMVKAVLLAPLPFPESNRIVALWESNPQRNLHHELVTPGDFVDWQAQSKSFESMGFSPAWPGGRWMNVVRNDGLEHIAGAYASSGWFHVLRVAPVLGRTFTKEEDSSQATPVAVLSYDLWQRWFQGDTNAIGKTLTVDSYQRRQLPIVGVMPRGFSFPSKSDLWISAGAMGVTVPAPGSAQRGGPWFEVIARLRPRISLKVAETEMATISSQLSKEHPADYIGSTAEVLSLRDQLVGSLRSTLFTLLGAVFLILLIACTNTAGLLVVRASGRKKEMVIRTALGAAPLDLVRQLVIESLFLSSLAGAAGIALAAVSLAMMRTSSIAANVPRLADSYIDTSVLGFTVLLSLLTGALFGVSPGLMVLRSNLRESLQEQGRSTATNQRHRMRQALIVSQVALALVLMTGTGLLVRSLIKLRSVDPGFRADQVLAMTLDMSGSRYADDPSSRRAQTFFRELTSQVSSMPSVIAVGGISILPLQSGGWHDRPGGGWSNQPFVIEGSNAEAIQTRHTADPHVVTPGYFRTLNIPLRAGREFGSNDTDHAPLVILINETMARRYWGDQNPVHRRISFDERHGQQNWREVVGVVGDVHSADLAAAPRPEFFLPYEQMPWYETELVVRTSADPSLVMSGIRQRVKSLDAGVPITRERTLAQMVDENTLRPRLHTALFSAFAVLALSLTAVGLYGMLAYGVSEKRREIGIRLAMGASYSRIIGPIVKEGVVITGVGIVIGLVGSGVATRMLKALLFEISPNDPFAFLFAVGALVGVSAVASYFPARRAAQVDPVIVLRHE